MELEAQPQRVYAVQTDGAFRFEQVPIPKRRGRPARREQAPRIPFGRIPVGFSYFVRNGLMGTVSAAAVTFARRSETMEFATRFMHDDPVYGAPGVRVWRLK